MNQDYEFYNLSNDNMSFDEAFDNILSFVKQEPNATYLLSVGTDAQEHGTHTRFITAIHIHGIRKDGIGRGAWGCLKKLIIPRRMNSLKEKISTELSLSQEIASLFTSDKIDEIFEILLPHSEDDINFTFSIHLDVGKKGATKNLINEMTGRIESMGLEAKIKPDSYAASSYANKYTK